MTDLIDYKIAKAISRQNIFPVDHDQMYYYVREGFQESNISEGFTSKFILTNDMFNGHVRLDG